MTYVVGLTGGIACGKTNLTDALRAAHAKVIDADEVSRALTQKGGKALPAIRDAFGNSVFDGDTLNRRALSQLIFSDETQREKLNAILHPMIIDELHMQLLSSAQQNVPIVFLSVPLLYETHLDTLCDEVWCAYLPKELQIRRLMQRDSITQAQARAKVDSQMPTHIKKKLADRIIDTRNSKESSAQTVLSLYQELSEKLREKEIYSVKPTC